MREVKTGGVCRVCRGEIVEKLVEEFDPRTGPAIIGPTSRHQYREVSRGYHCTNCGLKYEFV